VTGSHLSKCSRDCHRQAVADMSRPGMVQHVMTSRRHVPESAFKVRFMCKGTVHMLSGLHAFRICFGQRITQTFGLVLC
jgi:hypothetical protein